MHPIKHRNEFPLLFNALKFEGTGAEVGVQAGDFSEVLSDGWLGKLLLIDCWEHQSKEYNDKGNVGQQEQDKLYLSVQKRFEEQKWITVWKRYSLDAAAHVADGQLDFVYLDGNHSKDAVAEDLEAWLPKVRLGGIFAGHDYLDAELSFGSFGVKSAVTEFAARHGFKVYNTLEDWPSWYLINF